MKIHAFRSRRASLLCLAAALISAPLAASAQTIHLPSSKEILGPVPGAPRPMNSLPMSAAWSPHHRWLAFVNAGYGTAASLYQQSVAILDTQSGKLTDIPIPDTDLHARQTLYSGIAFSGDGRFLYLSFDSLSAPTGGQPGQTGNAIGVFRFTPGPTSQLKLDRLIPIPLRQLSNGQHQHYAVPALPGDEAAPAPTGLAVVPGPNGADRLVIADEFSDDAILLDPATGKVLTRFDLSSGPVIPTTYPIAVVASPNGRRAWVSLWNGSAVAQLNLVTGKVEQRLALLPPKVPADSSSHPVAMTLGPRGKTLYIALANRDFIAAVSVAGPRMRIDNLYDTRLPGQHFFGAMPDAVAVSADGATLYAANSGSDAVAVFNLLAPVRPGVAPHAIGFIPTEWYPTALAVHRGRLYVATAKGKGTGPNAAPQPIPAGLSPSQAQRLRAPHTYIASMLHGSLAVIDLAHARAGLPRLTRETVVSNLMTAAQRTIHFRSGHNPIRHVIYIIKENRTYDQILGDLGAGNDDPALTMYGESITPNLHALARRFGVLDNFYDSGEVSGDGHVWSNAAITSDYTERTWQVDYRGRERPYDYEGVVEEGYPRLEHIPDANQPESGYLWNDFARHHISYYHFGEYISSVFCDEKGAPSSSALPEQTGTPEGHHACAHPFIRPGDPIPANYGGGVSHYQWPIPLIYKNVATKTALVGHFDPRYPDFNLRFPDQLRVAEFLVHFRRWVSTLQQGHDTMPSFINLRLPNDHTVGTRPGWPTPQASVADNDLAVGRVVAAISHSPYWDNTAIFVLEDDAQNGADHVDAHRSIALVISKYAPHNPTPYVDHHFYTTVSTIHTMLTLLGAPPMNNNDAFAPLESPEFSGAGNQPPFTADYRNRDNGVIYQANTAKEYGAKESAAMDFTHEDRAPARELNIILWKQAMGNKPLPYLLLHPFAPRNQKDDDDN